MILICYGTRPEWIKVKPIIQRLKSNNKIRFKTLFTGQHVDIVEQPADYNLTIIDGSNRLDSIVQSILNQEQIFKDITHVMVQGDTTSVMSLALAAYHRKIKIIHLEAGLRTYDLENPWPEEMNRQLVSRMADVHLCPTTLNADNLEKEKCAGKKYVVGNTVLDNLVDVSTSYSTKVLVTLHRRENHDKIGEWFSAISKLTTKYPELEFVIPIHPNPNVLKFKDKLVGVTVIDPLPHDKLIELLANCRFTITDSGGIQEEGCFLNKKVIVCRRITERPESIGTHSMMCQTPSELAGLVEDVNQNYAFKAECPYGDGKSAERISNILETRILCR